MNIDLECVGLLSLILQDSPKDRNFILCVIARSNNVPARINFNPNSEIPTFYGYSNSRTPSYLMRLGVMSNVPRRGYAQKIITSSYLAYCEMIVNGVPNMDLAKKLDKVAAFITLANTTVFKDAYVVLVFRDKALSFIQDYVSKNSDYVSDFLGPELSKISRVSEISKSIIATTPAAEAEWSEDFRWEGTKLIFGKHGAIVFNSKTTKAIFDELFKAKGHWVEVSQLKKVTGKDVKKYIRPTIGQVQRSMSPALKKAISFPSSTTDSLEPKPLKGAYRIKYSPMSLP